MLGLSQGVSQTRTWTELEATRPSPKPLDLPTLTRCSTTWPSPSGPKRPRKRRRCKYVARPRHNGRAPSPGWATAGLSARLRLHLGNF
eukprot:scaffold32088_cov62-Phaeocystis_antarctica.AAC.4